MGWRGVLRSAGAAARRAERESQRRASHVHRLHQKAESLVGRLSQEAQRDLRKVEAFEEKIMQAPIRTLNLRYDEQGQWICQPLVDHTGDIHFSIGPGFASDPVAFSPRSIEFDGRIIAPLACCLSRYATLVAFSIATSSPSQKRRRLVNKTNPENGSVVLVAGDQAFYAFDGSVDGTTIPRVRKTGVIAFEPFVAAVPEFELAFVRPPTKKDPDPEPTIIKVTGPDIAREIAKFNSSPTLVDQFQGLVDQQVQATTVRVRSALPKRPRQTGCLLSILGALLVGGVLALLQTSRNGSTPQVGPRPESQPCLQPRLTPMVVQPSHVSQLEQDETDEAAVAG